MKAIVWYGWQRRDLVAKRTRRRCLNCGRFVRSFPVAAIKLDRRCLERFK